MKQYSETLSAVEIVDTLISDALDRRASDIHLEPGEKTVLVRYRIDGILHRLATISLTIAPQIVSRIKILAHKDVTERRLPQDGKIPLSYHERMIDLRIATFPTVHGEKVVIRVLDRTASLYSLNNLGMSDLIYTTLKTLLQAHQGFFLVTGPTGSGKSTTIYALLSELATSAKSIVTLEDPVEYTIAGISQTTIASDLGLTFLTGLRSLLRQDPDSIMIGEIRDTETARVAFQAALTGHLVMSTVHTADAITVPLRLLEMGVEPFLLSALNGIIAQRLVRRLCSNCKQKRPLLDDEQLFLASVDQKKYISREQLVYQAIGCDQCYHTG